MSDFKDIFEKKLGEHNLTWCKGGCDSKRSHKRGFVLHKDKLVVHLDSSISTRNSLHRGLHEIGHCVNDESGLRSFEKEAKAEKFASDYMRSVGISIPRKVIKKGKSYVKRKKRNGDNIMRGSSR